MVEDRDCQNDSPSDGKDKTSIQFPSFEEVWDALGKTGFRIPDDAQKLKALRGALEKERCLRYVFQRARADMVTAVQQLEGNVTKREFATTIRMVYRNAEYCYRDRFAWGTLFRKAKAIWGVTKDVDEKAAFDALPNRVKIYRACSEGEEDGISWTSCICVAERMQRDKGEGCVIFCAEISREVILAYMEGRDEYEIIVFPGDADEASVA